MWNTKGGGAAEALAFGWNLTVVSFVVVADDEISGVLSCCWWIYQ